MCIPGIQYMSTISAMAAGAYSSQQHWQKREQVEALTKMSWQQLTLQQKGTVHCFERPLFSSVNSPKNVSLDQNPICLTAYY